MYGAATHEPVMPRACGGIQYAAAPRFYHQCLWNTGSSAGACHRAAHCADPLADDDNRRCYRFKFQSAHLKTRILQNTTSRSRGTTCPSHQRNPYARRAWGMPGAWRTRSRAWCVESTRVSHHGRAGSPGIPARNGFNGFLRALLGDRALLSPSPRAYFRKA
jgi:hypothetical protein